MDIKLVKQLRESTQLPIKECVKALEASNWNYDVAFKNIYSIMTVEENDELHKPMDKSSISVFGDKGVIELLWFDESGRMYYTKGNCIDKTWEETELLVDLPKIGRLEDV